MLWPLAEVAMPSTFRARIGPARAALAGCYASDTAFLAGLLTAFGLLAVTVSLDISLTYGIPPGLFALP